MSASETPMTDNTVVEDDVFNAADADVYLRSSDGVLFAVHRCILRWISPFFADMLSLPQPNDHGAKSVIDMSEDAASLRLLLCFSYPRTLYPEPALVEVPEIKRAATLACKFDCNPLLNSVEVAIKHLAQTCPETAYALAWKFELRDTLLAAARAGIHRPWFIDDGREEPEFEELPSQSIILLGRYRSTFYAATQQLVDDLYPHPSWISKPHTETCRELSEYHQRVGLEPCTCEKIGFGFQMSIDPESPDYNVLHGHDVCRWWMNFVGNVIKDIKRCTIGEAIAKAVIVARKEARDCPHCRPVLDHDDAFVVTGQLLKEELERQLAKVPFQPPF